MSQSLALGALSFLLSLLLGPFIIALLRKKRVGKNIREEGPASHMVKAGTPTMGGIIIFVVVVLVTVPLNVVGRLSVLLPLGVIAAVGVLGAVDDLMNLFRKKGGGMSARTKFGWLTIIATIAALILHFGLQLTSVYVPFVGKFNIGHWYLAVAIFAIVGFANAVNLTDGLDSLAGGTTAIAFAAYAVIAYLQGQPYLVTFCFAVAGAVLGFLWYNAHPAEVFMGDAGSLALGATLASVALMTGQWLLLPVVGLVFVVETLSVMLQVAYFKLTKGKRIFKMAPLHHHFEMIGWSETQVSLRFWLVGMAMAMLGIALALS
ncbi:MAG: phospho-N-acetylmuramoyl-pentapeptide-transferase [Chloroflexota bacterium]|nr:MAG: phospho-N-acetylmuramoyl-pentapeptide-transferase [Chloroflexota bacterium]